MNKAHRYMPTLCTQSTATEKGGWGICSKQGKHGGWIYEESARETVYTACGKA